MSGLRDLKSQILVDDAVEESEVETIYRHIRADGHIDLDDLRFLVEVNSEARHTCPAFRRFLFDSIKEHVLEDREVALSEQFYLLKAFYADGIIDDEEKAFLKEIRTAAANVTPEFASMCDQVLAE